ncbi:hypothetical protein [Pseudoalteromonas sp. DY56-GL79]|uniref:hypothetical protein n=1 Tax=Pseudoalteromonas sp. DY56-GL79 TaxID=2967131 RepID=UPI00352A026A
MSDLIELTNHTQLTSSTDEQITQLVSLILEEHLFITFFTIFLVLAFWLSGYWFGVVKERVDDGKLLTDQAVKEQVKDIFIWLKDCCSKNMAAVLITFFTTLFAAIVVNPSDIMKAILNIVPILVISSASAMSFFVVALKCFKRKW